jgi:DNA-binding HxlR family transcriptional regulator
MFDEAKATNIVFYIGSDSMEDVDDERTYWIMLRRVQDALKSLKDGDTITFVTHTNNEIRANISGRKVALRESMLRHHLNKLKADGRISKELGQRMLIDLALV